jgi:hypothetical protein
MKALKAEEHVRSDSSDVRDRCRSLFVTLLKGAARTKRHADYDALTVVGLGDIVYLNDMVMGSTG